MVAASSRDSLRRSLVGIALEIQGTDESEVAYETGAVFLLAPPFPPLRLTNVLTFFYFTSAGESKARKLIVTYFPPVIVHSSPAPRPSIRLQEYKVFTEVLLEI